MTGVPMACSRADSHRRLASLGTSTLRRLMLVGSPHKILDVMKQSLVSALVLVVIVLTCAGFGGEIDYALRSIEDLVKDAYASDWTAAFVIAHLQENDNRWPTGWDDLKDEFDTLSDTGKYAWTFAELQHRVWLDWSADPRQIATTDPPITVFRLKSGRQASYGGDPNERIRDYLSKHAIAETVPP